MASMLRPCTRLRQPPGASPLSLPIPRALARAASSNPARRPPTGPRALTSPPAPPPATRPAQPQPQPQPQLQPQSQTQTQSPARKLPIPKWSIVPPPSGEPFPAPSRADATLPFWTAPTAHPSTGPGPGADPDPEPADPAGREIHQLAGIAPAAAERLCDALGVGMDWLAGVLSAAHDRKRPLDDVLAAAEGTRGKGGPGEALPRIALLVKDNKRFFAIKERLLRAALHNAPRHRAGRLLQQLVALKKADRLIAPSAPTVLAWHELDEEISRFVRAQAPGALTARAQAALGEMEDDAAAGMLSRARVRELVLRARHALEREVKDHPGPDSARAMTMLGNLWAEGRMGRAGSKKGQRTLRKECRYWWAKAAKLGHAPAISRLVFELSPLAAVDRYGERLLRAFPKLALAHASRLVLPKAWGGSLSAQFYYTDRALAPEEHRRRWGVLPDDAEAAERFAWAGRRGDGRGKLGWARMMLFGRAGLGDGRRWMARWEREWRAWWERGEAGGEEDMVPGTGDGGAGVERAREAREAKKARRAEAAGAEAEEDEGLEEDEDEDEWDEMEEDPGQESQERNIDQDEEVERRLTHLSAEVSASSPAPAGARSERRLMRLRLDNRSRGGSKSGRKRAPRCSARPRPRRTRGRGRGRAGRRRLRYGEGDMGRCGGVEGMGRTRRRARRLHRGLLQAGQVRRSWRLRMSSLHWKRAHWTVPCQTERGWEEKCLRRRAGLECWRPRQGRPKQRQRAPSCGPASCWWTCPPRPLDRRSTRPSSWPSSALSRCSTRTGGRSRLPWTARPRGSR
ncbi:hypothetical protein CALCODRAFT_316020 [Calocera cornea HHB12733]|uniref:Uncharacterized protein n=1 Tax=Calocera cornea HHB12733 TaxID=1353952 RepID=A0A165FAI8_9BASI|nr:hypothetical protein CALCODRAFT_316020 [Calocera cornea HHB12733]